MKDHKQRPRRAHESAPTTLRGRIEETMDDGLTWIMDLPRATRRVISALILVLALFVGILLNVSAAAHGEHYKNLVATQPQFSAPWHRDPWLPRVARNQWIEADGVRENLAVWLDLDPLPMQGELIKAVRDPNDPSLVVPVDYAQGFWYTPIGKIAGVLVGFSIPLAVAGLAVWMLLMDEIARALKHLDVRVSKLLSLPRGTGRRRQP